MGHTIKTNDQTRLHLKYWNGGNWSIRISSRSLFVCIRARYIAVLAFASFYDLRRRRADPYKILAKPEQAERPPSLRICKTGDRLNTGHIQSERPALWQKDTGTGTVCITGKDKRIQTTVPHKLQNTNLQSHTCTELPIFASYITECDTAGLTWNSRMYYKAFFPLLPILVHGIFHVWPMSPFYSTSLN